MTQLANELARRPGSRALSRARHRDALAAAALLTAVAGPGRRLYKAVVEEPREDAVIARYGGDQYRTQRRVARQLFKLLKRRGFLTDEAATSGAHNVLIDCRTDKPARFQDVPIVDDHGDAVPFTTLATSVVALDKDFRIQACKIRVFVNPEALTPQHRTKEGRSLIGAVIRDSLEE